MSLPACFVVTATAAVPRAPSLGGMRKSSRHACPLLSSTVHSIYCRCRVRQRRRRTSTKQPRRPRSERPLSLQTQDRQTFRHPHARIRDVVEGMEVVAYRWPSVRTSILAFFDCNVTRPRASRVTPTPHKCRACAPAALLHLRSLGNSACSLPQACASAALLHLRSLGQTRPVPSRSLNLMASWPRPSRRARARPFTCALYIRC